MSKYILLYKGNATDMSDMPEETQQQVIEGWKAWVDSLGSALVDIGAPMIPGTSLSDDGSIGEAVELNGYSVVEAENMDEAKKLCENHPFLTDDKGNFSIEIYELAPPPF